MKALYTIIILLIPFFGFGQIPDNISNNGLVGWWSFNGNANDESTNSNDGIVYGATLTTDRFGNENSAYEFNVESTGGWGSAQNRIVVENPSIPDVNAFTMSSWVLLNEKPSPFNNRSHTIMGRWDGNGTSVFRNQISYSGEYFSQIVIDDIESTHSSPNPINYNEWNHVVMTFDGLNLKKYINGELDSEISSSGQISYSVTDLTFGETHMANGHWYLFSGKMDDLSYWSRALTETEITELYNSTNGLLTYVPDDNFEQALIDLGYDNVLDDYVLTENINELTGLYINNKNIADLTGIEDFTALNYLSCGINQLTTLDLSSNTQLETLYASSNQLTSIDVSNSINLYQLDVSVSQLTDIDISNNPNLAYLNCGGNLLTNLDVSNNTNLVEIQCGNNSILALELSNNVNLSSVNCGFNEITSLDFSNNPDLTYINCRANELTFLNVTNNTLLNELNFSSNQLLNIDLTNNLLLEVVKGIYNNDLQTIDVSNNDSLKVLLLYACDLISIDLSNNLLLTEVNLNGNQLTNLDLSNNSNLIELVVSVNYNLTFLDLRNGNNINMSIDATASTLTCINVDDTEWATENWTNDNGSVDAQVSFSEDCQNLTYVPDDNFEQALIDFGYDNVLDDYVLTENISDITYLNVSTKGISDLTGIEDFESLEILYCFENNLSSLDISFNSNLITLYCYNNQITNIDISQNQNLESFDIGNNNLSSIDVSNNTSLTLLHCYNNQLSSIDVSQNTLLINLYCWGNQISNLDISQNLELTKLQCYDNLLSILDISLNTNLEDLYCSSNQLSSLDISNNIDLKVLRCGINQISNLDVSNNLDLEIIYCSNNSITELDVSTISLLSEFYCSVNDLTKLDVSNNTNLTILNCSNNDLDSLNLKNGSNTQMVLTATSNPDLFCITVDDTDWSSANWTTDNQSINDWNSFSEDCELGFVTFGCTDSSSCNFQPTANTDDGSCIYIESNDTIITCYSYFWNDSMYYQSGDYIDTLTSVEGCDSITNLNLIILQSDSIFNDTTVCDEFIWAEDTIISSGNYFFAYTNSNGCDSIHYFDVTINPSSEAIDEKFTCEDSFLWLDNNTYFEDNFTAQYIIANEYNCPLTITLNLTFLENPTSLTTVVECDSYTWNGSSYNTSGQYTYTTTAENGCDSTATLNLTINNTQFSTDVQFECNEFTWIDGITYTESNNSATVTLTANNGCDSIVTLNLTIYESDTTFSSTTACDEFIWNNISYTQSGFYTNTFENTNGCDSTHIYDLTILESTFGIDTQVQCDEYTWIDGNTYTQSTNSPTFTLTNSLGCDSTVTLNLTINLSDTSFTDVTACESFEWNGETYTESGTYTQSISSNNEFSMNFDGDDDYLFIEHSNSLEIGEGSISYEMWFKKSAVTFFSQTNLATNYINQTTPLIGLYVGGTNEGVNEGKLNFSYRTSQADSEVNLKSDFRVDDDIWHHVVGVKNTTTDSIYLYIDGELVNQTNILSGNTDTYQGYVLGGNHLNRFMNVDIDAFRIWSTALSQQKIQQYMNCPPSGNEEDLIGYWDFEEGEGNTVYDLTSNNNNGIINGATYSNDVPEQSCQLTAVNGCDSVAVLNLTITQPDTSITEVTACESYEWNGETYTESGTYTQSVSLNNEFSISFDGIDDYVDLSSISTIVQGNNIGSISLDFRMSSNAMSFDLPLFTIDLPSADPIVIRIGTGCYASNSSISFEDDDCGQSNPSIRAFWGDNPALLYDDEWHKISLVVGSDFHEIYLDGVLLNLSYSLGNNSLGNFLFRENTNTIEVGRRYHNTDSDSYFNGSLDNIQIWNTALSQSEIQQYMNCSPTGSETGLVGYWNFEEGEGNIVYDLSGNENHGIINGATYSSATPEQSCQLTTINGCDSIAILNLTITQPDTSFAEITACDSYEWNGVTLTESGTYFYPESQNLQTIDGFSYMGQLDNSLYFISENLTDWNDASAACVAAGGHLVSINSEEENNFIGTNLTNNSIWIGLYQASDNSPWQLTDGSDPTYFNWRSDQPGGSNQNCVDFYYDASVAGSVFENQYNVWTDANCNDNYYYILEIPSNELTTINGCDSVAVIDLTINESTFGIDTQVHCDEYTWIDGNTYTQSTNSPTFTLTNSLGCDSIVILDLSILESTSSFTSASACESYLWNDSLYTESGLKVFNTTNSVGCDSIARLFLTIYEPTFATDTQVHCDEFTWIDGISYTENNDSATHTIIGGNSNGCDSIVTLNLTIFNSVNTFGDTTVCDEFVWNGINYTESGIFSNTFENSNGCDSTHTYDLTILESTFGIDTQVHCDEYTWIDGNTYIQSTNSPTFTLTNSIGCDSIVTLNLNILESTSSFTSASACESYLWNDSLYTESGLKVFNTTNSVGCDSIARLFLTINEPTFATDIQVHCDEFTWIDGISYTESNDSATHTITGGNSNGCDSIVTLNLTIYNSDNTFGDTTACNEFVWNGISYTESGIFSNTFENSNGCDSTHTIDITILESTFGVDTQIHCDNYTWINGITYTESTSSPTYALTNSVGCDSVVTLNLSILESDSTFISETHCDQLVWDDSTYTISGIYTNYYTNVEGCDSSHTINLSIYYSDSSFDQITACDEFVWEDSVYTESGIYTNTYTNANGCDSTNTLGLTILNSSSGTDTQVHCDNYTWINGITYTESTSSPTYALTNSVGCDSVVTLNLSILESDSTFISETHCDQLVWDDSTYTISGIYTNYYTNVEGCDSSHTINLSIYYSDSSFDQITACDEFVWEDSVYTESGIYTNTYTNANGCDSTNTLGLTILNSSSGTDTQVHCDNYTWINGITYTESTSSPTYALTNSVGCDSVVTLNLSILESDSTFISETHCDQLVWDDSTYTISGIYTNYYTNVEGCDSSHTINLSIYYSDSSFDQITACDEFVWEDSVYTESGIYTNTYTNANGCDSTNTLGLTILNSSSGTDTQVHCDNYTWINGITYTESTSSPTYALTNSVGCDSVVTLNLSILESDSTFISETHCDQLVWDDSTYTISGIYTNYYTNVEGCDSSHTINLSIYYSDSSFAQITACDEFLWEDSVYTESGIYTNSYINSNGCDSTNTLDLTILNSSSGTDTQVHCDNYTWIDGITYTESTSSPTYALTNSVGCDSVVTLNLSILESDSTFISETHCDQLVWDDSTYTISGIYTNYYTNVEGCDSSHTINLSIYYSDSSFAQITACDEFLWEDSVYTESGIYTNSYINSNGCDSTNTLDLTILNSSSGTDTQVHCDNYTWIDGITYTESTSSPTYALTNSVGCDSVVTLNLSILESDSTFISETHCDQLVWDDSTYTISGIYTNYYTNVEGCDSSHTINLSIYYSDSSFAQITACDEFLWEDSVYTESGIYTNSYINSNGCDSTHTINLTILNSNNGTDVEEHCDEFTWIDGITYTESTSSPTYTLTNSVGCDSLVTLNLTIYNSYNLDTNITSCDAFVWDDSTYIESGVYTNNYTSINGCDSVYTINLSLLETTYGIDSIVSCDEYTWIDGISYTENTNSPTFTLTNSVGCDSVVNLNLTILESTETNTSIVACDNFEWYGTTYYQSGTYYNYSINSIGCDLIEVLELTIEYCGCIDPVADNFNPNATLDDGSCVYCESFSIIITASSDVSEFGGNDGYVFASGIGGSAQYSLNVFDENFIPQNPFGLTAGIYTVAVFDAVTGCVAETLFTIYEPTVYFNCTNLGCVESSVIDDSYYTLEECEANCSSVTVSPCDSVPNGLFVDNVIDNRIRFNWSPTEVAPSHYMIRYRELGTNSWTVITAGPVNTQAYYGTSRTRYFMEPATTYEWSIRARVLNDDLSIDCQSAWSATSEYTTLPACANLENLSVFTEANWVTFFADAPSEEWGVWQSKGKIREFGSTSYRYVNGDDNGNINSLKGNFTESTNYEWHTKAWCTANVDEDGNSDPMYHSGWGEFSNFTTEDPCDKMPINLSTSSNGANTAVIMSWDTPLSGNPDHYFLEMTNITSGDVYEWNNIPGTDNSKTKFNQSSGDEISWKIRGACGTNGTSFATPFSSTVYYVLGGEKLSNVQNLLVYPNPSRNEFNISFDISERQIVDVKVVNSIGQEVYENSLEIKGTFDTKIDLSGYSKGVYNLSIETTDGIKNHKLILQ